MIKMRDYSSFRDPAGFVFVNNGSLYRQINYKYKDNYDYFLKSSLYQKLSDKKYIVSFNEVQSDGQDFYKIIKPERIDFISYPYEWCFSQYKDAALLTLEIQKIALLTGMTLKDASAYNIQFQNNKPIHIDTLSFEKLDPQKPWCAYQQFCQHFLAPLALMAFVDPKLNVLMQNYIDGIPLSLAARLLPKFKSYGVFVNIHLNAWFSNKNETVSRSQESIHNMTLNKHLILIDSLYHTIKNLKFSDSKTEWGKYYENTNYNDNAFKLKEHIVGNIISKMPKDFILWDFGANNGHFTRLATAQGIKSVSFDIDINAVEKNYQHCKKHNELFPFPLIVDLTNPSPSIGWDNLERISLFQRSSPDVIMALALIHHLIISKNIPFDYISRCFSRLAPNLIIEFVPKEDSQVKKLLSTRSDIWENYTEDIFRDEFLKYYSKFEKYNIPDTKRAIYLFQK